MPGDFTDWDSTPKAERVSLGLFKLRQVPKSADSGSVPDECRDCRNESVWWDLFAALADALFMNLLGFLSGSMALHAQGLHSLGDFLTKGVTLVSVKSSQKAPNPKFPYGFGKIQFISAAVVGLSLIAGALFFVYENMRHINEGLLTPPDAIALVGPMISMFASWLLYRYLDCVGRQNNSLAINAAALDNRMDFYSAAAILVGILLAVNGWPMADHLVAILASLFALRIGYEISAQAVHGLMDMTVPNEVLARIRLIASRFSGVQGIDHLRGRRLGETWEIDLHMVVPGNMPTRDSHEIAQRVKSEIFREIKHTGHVNITVVPGVSQDSPPLSPS